MTACFAIPWLLLGCSLLACGPPDSLVHVAYSESVDIEGEPQLPSASAASWLRPIHPVSAERI